MEVARRQISGMKSARLTLAAGLSLLIPPAVGFLCGLLFARNETATLFYPIPCLVLLPGFFVGPLAFFVPTVLFFIWNAGLFNGDPKTPKRTHVLFVIVTILSSLWFVAGWKDGVVVQGPLYNFSVLGINIAWIAILLFKFIRNWKSEPSFKANLLLHWLLFLWLAWYAFPFFGEVI